MPSIRSTDEFKCDAVAQVVDCVYSVLKMCLTGCRNILIFRKRRSVQNEVSPPHLLFIRTACLDLGSLATRRIDEFDWAGV